MLRKLGIIAMVFLLTSAGCAARHKAAPRDVAVAPPTQPAQGDISALALEDVQPRALLTPPATLPAGEAPLEALELYARARDSLQRNQPWTAVNLLEQAARLDPDSAELNKALGTARLRAGNLPGGIEAYERAAELAPDDLILQAELGRAYMARGDSTRGIYRLRMARKTSDYGDDPAIAAAVDYRLGVALQEGGYDRAALEVFEALLARLRHPEAGARANPEIVFLINRPEFLLEQVGRLYEKTSQPARALEAYQFIADRSPRDFAARARVVKILQATGRSDEAVRGAARLVNEFGGSAESLALMKDVYHKARRDDDLIRELRRLSATRPTDRTLLFALADALEAAGRPEDADELLETALRSGTGDSEVLERLARLQVQRGQPQRAASLLIETAARNSQLTGELEPLWDELTHPGRRAALRIDDVRGLAVAADAAGARDYFLARTALAWSRSAMAQSALERAVQATPIFPPALRAALSQVWSLPAQTNEQKRRETERLKEMARDHGDNALALELEGMALLSERRAAEAVAVLAQALEQRPDSPELGLSHAGALRAAGNTARFEQLAWRLISDHPRFEPAYTLLFRHHMERGAANPARNVLTAWLVGLPRSVEARIVDATVLLRVNNQPEQARRVLLTLFDEYPERAEVLANLRSFYAEIGRAPELVTLLEERRGRQPENYLLVAQLVDLYADQKRLDEASRVLDAARSALADDPQRLYFVAHLYGRIEQPQVTEDVLGEVLRADPDFAPAGNDLGYTWADSGRNLDRAESLIRRAVQAEPANPMFLDSLGWVLYKRGSFVEARHHLQDAVDGARGAPDAVVLDHLGDAFYRLEEHSGAIEQWRLALERFVADANGDDPQRNALRLGLESKLKQAEQGIPVSVAPLGEEPAALGRARN